MKPKLAAAKPPTPTRFADLPDILTLDEAAAYLRISYVHCWRECEAGRLRHRRSGRRVLIFKQALLEWLDAPDPRQVEDAGTRLLGAKR